MEDKVLEQSAKQESAKTTRRRKVKTWGDDGFVGKAYFGCYDYDIRFVPQDTIKKITNQPEDFNVYGAINYFEQIIYIASDSSPQCKRATLLHELVHAIFLQNGSVLVGSEDEVKQDVQSEILVDRTANGIFEIMRRNPEIVKWLTK